MEEDFVRAKDPQRQNGIQAMVLEIDVNKQVIDLKTHSLQEQKL